MSAAVSSGETRARPTEKNPLWRERGIFADEENKKAALREKESKKNSQLFLTDNDIKQKQFLLLISYVSPSRVWQEISTMSHTLHFSIEFFQDQMSYSTDTFYICRPISLLNISNNLLETICIPHKAF